MIIINCLIFVAISRSDTGGDRRLQNMEIPAGTAVSKYGDTGGDRRLQNMGIPAGTAVSKYGAGRPRPDVRRRRLR
jgi:hypothetical protein